MRIGLIDVDAESRGKVTFPNLSLMKISAWHKANGDTVEWYTPMAGKYDKVYMSKIFGREYTNDYIYPVNAEDIVRAGSGYAFTVVDGRERYDPALDHALPYEIDHIMPDYGMYGIYDKAYGFLTKGCPRGCAFCHTSSMQGRHVVRFANLNEFWSGQKNIVLLDPNITASTECTQLFKELENSGSYIDFNQGLDIRFLTGKKLEALNKVKWKRIHFAWDNPDDDLKPLFEEAKKNLTRWSRSTISCYVLTNFNSTHEQDLKRINAIRELGMQPVVQIYRKHTAPSETRKLQRWCSPFIFWKCERFEDYDTKKKGDNK